MKKRWYEALGATDDGQGIIHLMFLIILVGIVAVTISAVIS